MVQVEKVEQRLRPAKVSADPTLEPCETKCMFGAELCEGDNACMVTVERTPKPLYVAVIAHVPQPSDEFLLVQAHAAILVQLPPNRDQRPPTRLCPSHEVREVVDDRGLGRRGVRERSACLPSRLRSALRRKPVHIRSPASGGLVARDSPRARRAGPPQGGGARAGRRWSARRRCGREMAAVARVHFAGVRDDSPTSREEAPVEERRPRCRRICLPVACPAARPCGDNRPLVGGAGRRAAAWR
mmetsp:Transcript_134072/g.388055  ORF Transcript_134072/g.388055 Transcript_134072/m.388055 type:complete len:243 (-) Transcript_134072:378-1106(-)